MNHLFNNLTRQATQVKPFDAGEALTPRRLNEMVDALNAPPGVKSELLFRPQNTKGTVRLTSPLNSYSMAPHRKFNMVINTTNSGSPTTGGGSSIYNNGVFNSSVLLSSGRYYYIDTWLYFLKPLMRGIINVNLQVYMFPNFAAISPTVVAGVEFRQDTWDYTKICWNNQPPKDPTYFRGLEWKFSSSNVAQSSESIPYQFKIPEGKTITGIHAYALQGTQGDSTSAQISASVDSIYDFDEPNKIAVVSRSSTGLTRTVKTKKPHGLIDNQTIFIYGVDKNGETFYDLDALDPENLPASVSVVDNYTLEYNAAGTLEETQTGCGGYLYL